MTEDWNRFLSVVQTDKEGSRLNLVKVDGVDSTDEKVIGKRLQEIAKNATTGGLYKLSGNLRLSDKGGQREDTQRRSGVH